MEVYALGIKSKVEVETEFIGSGPGAGIIEVSSKVKSTASFNNAVTSSAKDFVYDPNSKTFLLAGDNYKLGHTGLVRSINANDATVVGGRIKLNSAGQMEASQWSGHYGENWTSEISKEFGAFMKKQTGIQIKQTETQYFSDGTNK